MSREVDLEEVRRFSRLLHPAPLPEGAIVVVCADPNGIFSAIGDATDEESFVAAVAKAHARRPRTGIWATVNLADAALVARRRREEGKPGTRGLKEHFRWTVTVVADLDTADGVHEPPPSGRPLPDRDTALGLIDGLPAPTLLVDSGGGWQGWWVLEAPATDPVAIDAATTGVRAVIQGNADTAGVHFDSSSTGDPTRVLRVPGTWNTKGDPVPVTVADPAGSSCTFDQLAACGPVAEVHAAGQDVWDQFLSPAPGWVDEAVADYARRATWDQVLVGAGWRLVGHDASERRYLRPGEPASATSATVYAESDRLTVYSTATDFGDPIAPGGKRHRTWDKVGAAAVLAGHPDDAAGRVAFLRAQGYGPATPRAGTPGLVGAEGVGSPEMPSWIEEELNAWPGLRAAVRELQVKQRAREIVAEIEAGRNPLPPPDAGTLAEMLARPDEVRWRLDGLLPAGGRLLLSAQRKTGKSTAVGNLARSLLTGESFLGRFPVARLRGRVVVLNYEVTAGMFARWMTDIGVPPDRLYVVNLRGARNLLADETGRAELVELIRAADGEVLVVDPFGRAYTGKNQNDAAEVTPWLNRLDEVADAAGITELVLVAHAGWNGERTRGSSALEDWPDVIATMTRDPDTDVRFLKAEGRDVEVPEDELSFDPATRRLTMTGAGNRVQVRAVADIEQLAEAIRDIVAATPGLNVSELRDALRDHDQHLQREDVGKAAKVAIDRGWIVQKPGKGNAKLHYPPGHPESSQGPPGDGEESSRPSQRGGTTTHRTSTADRPGGTTPPEQTTLDLEADPCSSCGHPLDSLGHELTCEVTE